MATPLNFDILVSAFSSLSIVSGVLAIAAVLLSLYLVYRGVLFILDMLIGYDMYRYWDGD
jgi:hypothetical protein